MGKEERSQAFQWMGRIGVAAAAVSFGISCAVVGENGQQQAQQPGLDPQPQGYQQGGAHQGLPSADHGWPPNQVGAGAQQHQGYPVQPLGQAPSTGQQGAYGYPSSPGYAPDQGAGVNVPAYQGAAPQPPAQASQQHTVKSGETLWRISRQYTTTVNALQQANGMTSDIIQPGQVLNIP